MKLEFKSDPMAHQMEGMRRAWRKTEFALFWEMGTGKTFTTVNLAAARFIVGGIDAVIVICPTPIKMVWEDEIKKWCTVEHRVVTLRAGGHKEFSKLVDMHEEGLLWLIIGVESLSQGNAFGTVQKCLKDRNYMAVCDESSRIKNHKSTRTKNAISIAKDAQFRLILTGTPITQGMHDLYAQFMFLNPSIIGLRNFTLFKRFYCITQQVGDRRGMEKIIGYINTDKLLKKCAPYVDIVKKEQVLDLPPKVYERLVVEPSPNQLRLIKDLEHQMWTTQGDETLETETILERLTRFQQIIGGNFPYGVGDGKYDTAPIEGPNPKITALMELLETLPEETKVIIWARFVPEIKQIKDALSSTYGYNEVVTFYGGDDDGQRRSNVVNFKEGQARYMVSNPALGGMGQTWTSATCVVYYSNSFSFEDRMQSEDRAHRKGQEHAVTYVDIEVNHKYDKMILGAIRAKQDVANMVEQRLVHEKSVGINTS